jgi:uncharacterized protein (TIGR03435 family)
MVLAGGAAAAVAPRKKESITYRGAGSVSPNSPITIRPLEESPVKSLILRLTVALAALPGSTLSGQDLAGTWQGSVHVGAKELRDIIRIAKGDKGLTALLFRIDQFPGQSYPSSAVTVQGISVRILFPALGSSYNGTLSADGNSIMGTLTEGQTPLGLDLHRATTETVWELPTPPRPKRMTDADPAFAVASIKLSVPEDNTKGIYYGPRRLTVRNESLRDLLTFAYGVHPSQISGGPAWIATDKYDITAEPDADGIPSDRQWRVMLQKFIADRFKLTSHPQNRTLAVYTITLGSAPLKMIPSTGEPDGPFGFLFPNLGTLTGRNANVDDLAGLLQTSVLDRPVIDQTRLKGRYDFMLSWTADEFQFTNFGVKLPPPPENGETRPDLFTAMQQQLGLKLRTAKFSVGILVIDKVAKPSEN